MIAFYATSPLCIPALCSFFSSRSEILHSWLFRVPNLMRSSNENHRRDVVFRWSWFWNCSILSLLEIDWTWHTKSMLATNIRIRSPQNSESYAFHGKGFERFFALIHNPIWVGIRIFTCGKATFGLEEQSSHLKFSLFWFNLSFSRTSPNSLSCKRRINQTLVITVTCSGKRVGGLTI